MSFLKSLRGSSSGNGTGDGGSPDAAAHDNPDLPIARYDHLDGKKLTDEFRKLTQVQLEAVEDYERSHKERTPVLAKLRYLRMEEPIPGYDNLEVDQIKAALDGADAETIKTVRYYERKFRRRHDVLTEIARVLPNAAPSERELKSQEEKDARVRAKMRPTT